LTCVVALAFFVSLWRKGARSLVAARRSWIPFALVFVWTVLLEAVLLDRELSIYGLLAGLTAANLVAGSRAARDGRMFLAIAITTMFVMTAAWLPFDWPRYYLPIIAVMAVGHAAGMAELLRLTSTATVDTNEEPKHRAGYSL
jgi:hypothetical protein